jgi:two-component system response regulator AtoC
MLHYLQERDWPGNVRELANGIARYVLIGPEAALAQELPRKRRATSSGITMGVGSVPLKRIAHEAIREVERNVILEALRANKWNRRSTAEALKISYRALIYKIRQSGIAQRN